MSEYIYDELVLHWTIHDPARKFIRGTYSFHSGRGCENLLPTMPQWIKCNNRLRAWQKRRRRWEDKHVDIEKNWEWSGDEFSYRRIPRAKCVWDLSLCTPDRVWWGGSGWYVADDRGKHEFYDNGWHYLLSNGSDGVSPDNDCWMGYMVPCKSFTRFLRPSVINNLKATKLSPRSIFKQQKHKIPWRWNNTQNRSNFGSVRRKDETVLSAFCQDHSPVDGVFTGNP